MQLNCVTGDGDDTTAIPFSATPLTVQPAHTNVKYRLKFKNRQHQSLESIDTVREATKCLASASSSFGFALTQQKAVVSGWAGDSLQQEPVVLTNVNIICQATPFTVPLLCVTVLLQPCKSSPSAHTLEFVVWTIFAGHICLCKFHQWRYAAASAFRVVYQRACQSLQ